MLLAAAGTGFGIMAATSGLSAEAGVVTFYRGVGGPEAAQIARDHVLKAVNKVLRVQSISRTPPKPPLNGDDVCMVREPEWSR